MILLDTPIIVHFRQLALHAPGHFNQSVMLNARRRINMFTLKGALGILCQYHDMLRATWDGSHLVEHPVMVDGMFHLEEHDFSGSSDAAEDMLLRCERLQSSIDLTHGPMMRVAVFHLLEKDVMLIVVHHLVVDGVSWRIMIEDLNKIYTTLLQGNITVRLPKRRSRFAQYAKALNEYAESAELLQEANYWQQVVDRIKTLETPSAGLSFDYGDEVFALDADATSRLLGEGNKTYGAGIDALLLTALVDAWHDVTGQTLLSLAQEGHGREAFGAHPLSLERLVGWFTTIYPVALEYKPADKSRQVEAMQTMLRNIPRKGLGYGVLTHIARTDSLRCRPLMTFNYLGSMDEVATDSFFTINHSLPRGNEIDLQNCSDTPLAVNCHVAEGALTGTLTYDKGVMETTVAKRLCESFLSYLKSL